MAFHFDDVPSRLTRLDFGKNKKTKAANRHSTMAHVSVSAGHTFQVNIRHMGNTHFEKARIGLLPLPGEAAFQQYRCTDGMQGTKIAQVRASDDVRVS